MDIQVFFSFKSYKSPETDGNYPAVLHKGLKGLATFIPKTQQNSYAQAKPFRSMDHFFNSKRYNIASSNNEIGQQGEMNCSVCMIALSKCKKLHRDFEIAKGVKIGKKNLSMAPRTGGEGQHVKK